MFGDLYIQGSHMVFHDGVAYIVLGATEQWLVLIRGNGDLINAPVGECTYAGRAPNPKIGPFV